MGLEESPVTEKKKRYERPLLTKVRLDVASSVLALCNTSTQMGVEPICRTATQSCAVEKA
jgi:hypothetical protein